MDEEWRPVVGYEGQYEVSSFGFIKSIERISSPRTRGGRFRDKTDTRKIGERILKAHINYAGGRQGGRFVVVLCKQGIMKQFQVHRLVAEAFIPNPNNLSDVSHVDHNPQNNRVDNLEWLSHRENIRDSVRAGRWRKKLSEDQVKSILERAKNGELQISIAKDLGLAYGTINSIVTGRSWKHISNPGTITLDMIESISSLAKEGKSPTEILTSIYRKQNSRK